MSGAERGLKRGGGTADSCRVLQVPSLPSLCRIKRIKEECVGTIASSGLVPT